jgi:VIT1/CCC1 family predicted Fe2+/Mn2+ transporter
MTDLGQAIARRSLSLVRPPIRNRPQRQPAPDPDRACGKASLPGDRLAWRHTVVVDIAGKDFRSGAVPGAESHYVNRTGWLRAAVLGANDGIISTASLIVGVAAAAGSRGEILTAAIAGWAAGAMSMAAGEYVSVSSQADSEAADLEREQRALTERPAEEKEELAHIYEERGVQPKLAKKVARQLMARDALDAHARDELGLSEGAKPRPI